MQKWILSHWRRRCLSERQRKCLGHHRQDRSRTDRSASHASCAVIAASIAPAAIAVPGAAHSGCASHFDCHIASLNGGHANTQGHEDPEHQREHLSKPPAVHG